MADSKTYGTGTGRSGKPCGYHAVPKITGGYNPIMQLGVPDRKGVVVNRTPTGVGKTTKGVK